MVRPFSKSVSLLEKRCCKNISPRRNPVNLRKWINLHTTLLLRNAARQHGELRRTSCGQWSETSTLCIKAPRGMRGLLAATPRYCYTAPIIFSVVTPSQHVSSPPSTCRQNRHVDVQEFGAVGERAQLSHDDGTPSRSGDTRVPSSP